MLNRAAAWVSTPRRRFITLTSILFGVSFLIFYTSSWSPRASIDAYRSHKPIRQDHSLDSHIAHLKEVATWNPPSGMKVIALVFYGRRRYVSILECYLQRNLVKNGGILDEVLFVAKTDDQDDLAYLDELLATNPEYSAQYQSEKGLDFSGMYSAVQRGNIYVKIDDDVLYISDSTIRAMVKQKVEHPEYLMVSANLVVQFAIAWVHSHIGAVHPYLPDLGPLNATDLDDWRPSQLPSWSGPQNWDYANFKPPMGHRWLPVPADNPHHDKTPMDMAEYTLGNSMWHTWMVGAQQHMSFLQNLENDELWRYAFDLWDARYNRVSINLFVMTGDDLVEMGPMPGDDEKFITMTYSEKTGRHCVIDGHGLAVHHGYMSFSSQGDDDMRLAATDTLDRYRLYANENICVR